MWAYLFRRLLLIIPTLFGVTLVSFLIMQLAPGDPLLTQLGSGGTASQSGQTPESYRAMKRDLKLDKPLVLNFNFFRDYLPLVRVAAHYRSLSVEQIAAELPLLAAAERDADVSRLAFLRSLDIPDFNRRLAQPESYERLARAIEGYVQRWCEDEGTYAVPAAMAILNDPQSDERLRIGVIRALAVMVDEPFQYTLPQNPTANDIQQVQTAWRLWWERNRNKLPPLEPDTKTAVEKFLDEMAALTSRRELQEKLDELDRDQASVFIDALLGAGPLRKQEIAAMALQAHVRAPLAIDVPLDATSEQVAQVAENWDAFYAAQRDRYDPSVMRRLWNIVADTQYAHMLARLATFQFGRSALKLREPVSTKIWDAFWVSAPLMVMAQLVIYLVAVPLGILCAVDRGGWWDRSISLGLFLLYSIPSFVAGMLLLLFLCYGDYLSWFPMEGLHSNDADDLAFVPYLLDYFWHAALPVICLSLFSLASMAMFSRSAMLDVVNQDYIRTARAKGLSSGKVILNHALRNALIPIITLFASFLPALLGGSVLVEVIFNIPGMGRLAWMSIEYKDFPTLMALIYIDAIVVMVSILLADMLYVVADPRISFESHGGGG